MLIPTFESIAPVLQAHELQHENFIIVPKTFTMEEFNADIEVGRKNIILPYRLRGTVFIPDYNKLYMEDGYDFITITGDSNKKYDFRNAYRIEHPIVDPTFSPTQVMAQLTAPAYTPYNSWLRINYEINKNALFGQHFLFVDYFLIKLN